MPLTLLRLGTDSIISHEDDEENRDGVIMAMKNVGGASNDATGSALIRRSLTEKLDQAYDCLEELKSKALTKSIDHPIHLTIRRQENEIRILLNKKRSVGG
jgi:hypothetical protein